MKDEVLLEEGAGLTFLGLELRATKEGIQIGQWKFIDALLEKHGMTDANPITTVQMDAPGIEDIPSSTDLRDLQAHSGEVQLACNS